MDEQGEIENDDLRYDCDSCGYDSRIRDPGLKIIIDPKIKPTLWIYPQLIKLAFIFVFAVDPSLSIVERLNIVPYGIIWQYLNLPSYLVPYSYGKWTTYQPFVLMEFQYKAYLLLVDTIVTWFSYKKLDHRVFWIFQILQVHWFTGFFQNISVGWTSILGAYNPVFTLISVLTKLPVGWSLSLSDPHVQCALTCGGPGNVFSEYFAKRALPKVVSYTIQVAWWLLGPFFYVLRRRSKNLKAHSRQL